MADTLGPVLLRGDNFTPVTRTPWGGERILTRFKPGLMWQGDRRVGEAWEFSLEPSFPSRIAWPAALAGCRLDALIAADPLAWCGAGRAPTLLLKLLDAAERLSLQVHPADDDPALGPDESGKPEAWIVLDHAPSAGIWLGLADGVQRREVEEALDGKRDLEPLLHFIPVRAGDTFVIAPGTVHAIGAGVTLLEPQRVQPGKRGVTYRFWDWGRCYDSAGKLSVGGTPRPIHRARALAVTDWAGPRGAELEAHCRRQPRPLAAPAGLTREGLLALGPVEVERLRGEGSLSLHPAGTLHVLYVTRGAARCGGVLIAAGRALVLPASAGEAPLTLEPQTELFILRESGASPT